MESRAQTKSVNYRKPLQFKVSANRENAQRPATAPPILPLARPWWLGSKGLLGLLISTAFAEIAGGAVFVSLIERAYQLGGGMTGVGAVLLVQSATQALFGFGAGGLADTWGQRKTAGIAALASALLAAALAFSNTMFQVYILGLLLTATRLLLIPARFGLVAQVTSKDRFVDTNTGLALLSGAGSFIGPAMVTTLLIVSDNHYLPPMAAAVGSLLSIPPLALINSRPNTYTDSPRLDVWREMRQGLQVIQKRLTIRQVLWCLVNITLLLGAAMPLFTPLGRQVGLGAEGTSIFFTALGFGYLLGPFVATALFKRMRLSTALFLAGLCGPVGVAIIGIVPDLEIVLVAVGLIAVTSAGVNVMVTTVVQRLSPREYQSSVLGVQQALVGIAWTFSLAVITGIAAIWPHLDIQLLFLQLGAFGLLALFGCWLWSQRSPRFACDMCEASSRSIHFACWVGRNVPFQLPGFVTRGKCSNGTCLCHK
jgi:MFS family permease